MKKELVVTILIALCGTAVTFGVSQNQIANNKEAIQRIEGKQVSQSETIQAINQNLAAINTKLDFIIDGKLQATYREAK